METIGADLRQMQRTPLAAAHVDALRAAGKVQERKVCARWSWKTL
jgi:thioredoxin reductase (NADPH)